VLCRRLSRRFLLSPRGSLITIAPCPGLVAGCGRLPQHPTIRILVARDISSSPAHYRHNIHFWLARPRNQPPPNQRRKRFQECRRRLRLLGTDLTPDRSVQQLHARQPISPKYRGSFNTLAFGEIKPHSGSLKDGRLDLVYHQNPGVNIGDPFPLWTLH
jgi:hypothetical protein